MICLSGNTSFFFQSKINISPLLYKGTDKQKLEKYKNHNKHFIYVSFWQYFCILTKIILSKYVRL